MRIISLAVLVMLLPLAGAQMDPPMDASAVASPQASHGSDIAVGQASPGTGHATTDLQAWIWSDITVNDATAALAAADLTFHVLPQLEMVTFVATPAMAHNVASFGRLDAAERLSFHLDRSVAAVGGDAVRDAVGPARDGPTVLVVDTGVDGNHPDFNSVLVANVIPKVAGGLVVGSLEQVPVVDTAGHGTHVASIVAGSGQGASTASTGKYEGFYSQGRIASYQVVVGEGEGDPDVDTLAALEAFEWALTNRALYNIRVVTNSWGDPGEFDPDHAVNQATLRLYKAGMVVVFSAGNEGRQGGVTLNKYCQAPWALCVAAADLDRARASFSSFGNSDQAYSHADLTAPGVQITAAAPIVSSRVPSSLSEDRLYSIRSGTSMAAPHVAGTAALLLAAKPSLSPDQVMDILVGTTTPMSGPVTHVGTGFLNAREAYNLALGTVGDASRFDDGAWKYAGKSSGDAANVRDPVTIGFDGTVVPTTGQLAGDNAIWLLSSPVAWVMLAAAILAFMMGVRWRQSPTRAATRSGPGKGPARAATAQRSPVRAAGPVQPRRTPPVGTPWPLAN